MVEDSADDAELVARALRRQGFEPSWRRVADENSLAAALTECQWGVVLVDHRLPGFSSQRALELIQRLSPQVPPILVSGAIGEEMAAATIRAGAYDFVSKEQLARLGPAVDRALTERRLREDRNHAEAELARLAAIVEHTEDAILAKSPQGIITAWNASAERLYGYPPEEAIGKPVAMLSPPERCGENEEILRRALRGEPLEQHETVRIRKDGTRVHVSLTVSPVRDGTGAIVGVSSIGRDISERKRFEGQLQYLADHDSLTGLFNRRRFEDELVRELARARRFRTGGAVLVIDLDHFKLINDSLGHAAGDELITRVGEIFRRRVRTTDVLARIGGDEFAVLLPGVSEAEANMVATSLLEAVRGEACMDLATGRRRMTASIGIAPFHEVGNLTGEELVVEADIAMYDAKEAGRDRATLYDARTERQKRMQAHLSWGERIQAALNENRFVLHAQPILALDGDTLPRHELLLRMLDEQGDLIPPGVFLYIAEDMDLIGEVDRWVLQEGVGLLAREQNAGRDVRLELNISAKSVSDPNLPQVIADELEKAGADGRGLCLEITETAAIVNIDRAKRFARQLAGLGCQFALDDFGAGFASFYYLKHLDFDYLKIDGEFINRLATNHTNQLVVRAVVDIARGLNKRTIAEFVGDQQTLNLLRDYGVDYAQGFFIGEPKPLHGVDLARPTIMQ